jgi:hypothetical protein
LFLCSPKRREECCALVADNVVALACHPFGCRVAQKVLDVCSPDHRRSMTASMSKDVLTFIADHHANHVVSKCIDVAEPVLVLSSIVDQIAPHCVALASDAYGCRVLQRLMQRCPPSMMGTIVTALLDHLDEFLSNQYGTFVGG